MSDVADDPKAARQKRHEHRVAAASAPYGPLALAGTLPRTPSGGTPRLADYPEGRIPAVPGLSRPTGDGVAPTASIEDGAGPDGEPFTGGTVLAEDEGPPAVLGLICPFQPLGNTLPFEAAAGGQGLKGALAACI